MGLVAAKCTNCGASISIDNSKEAGICLHCGTAFITEKVINNYNTYVTQNITKHVHGNAGKDIEELLTDGINLYNLAQFKKAYEVFQKAIETDPMNWKAWLYYAESGLAAGGNGNMLSAFISGVRILSEDGEVEDLVLVSKALKKWSVRYPSEYNELKATLDKLCDSQFDEAADLYDDDWKKLLEYAVSAAEIGSGKVRSLMESAKRAAEDCGQLSEMSREITNNKAFNLLTKYYDGDNDFEMLLSKSKAKYEELKEEVQREKASHLFSSYFNLRKGGFITPLIRALWLALSAKNTVMEAEVMRRVENLPIEPKAKKKAIGEIEALKKKAAKKSCAIGYDELFSSIFPLWGKCER